MRELVTFFDFLLVVSAVLGTGLGIVFGWVLGPAKLSASSRCISAPGIEIGFKSVYGPLLGLKGELLQKFLGIGEIVAGWIVLICVWFDIFCLFPKFARSAVVVDIDDFMNGMAIVAAVGLIAEMGVAAAMHQRLSEFDGDDSEEEEFEELETVYIKGGKKGHMFSKISKSCIPGCYAIVLTVFVFVRIAGFCPQETFTKWVTMLMSFTLLLLAGFMVYHAHEHGRHRREIKPGIDKLFSAQAEDKDGKGGMLL